MRRSFTRVIAPLALFACATLALAPSAARAEDDVPGVTAPAGAAPDKADNAAGTQTEKTTYKESVVVERTTQVVTKEVVAHKRKDNYKCAIFVTNRSKKVDDDKVRVMEDSIIGHATEKGFSIISREVVMNAVAKLADAGPNKGDKRLPGEELDELLSNNTSALRLAQNMDADYILFITISSYGTDRLDFNDPKLGINVTNAKTRLRATYRLLDGTTGGSQTAGVATACITRRVDARTVINEENTLDDLLDSAAEDLAGYMGRAAQGGQIPGPEMANKQPNTFTLHCGIADLNFPEIVKDDHGQYLVTANHYRLESLAVAVELDGVLVGTTPGPFTAKPGLHKLRLRREKFRDYTATVNIADGQVLQIALQFTPEGLREFAEMTKFIQDLKINTILSEAQARMWEGYAKQMEQSGVKIEKNVTKNIKINDDQGNPKANATTPDKADLRKQITGEDEPQERQPAPARQPEKAPARETDGQ